MTFQLGLFEQDFYRQIILQDGILDYYPFFLTSDKSKMAYEKLLAEVAWKQENIYMYGKHIPVPRLTAWYGDIDAFYSFSGKQYKPSQWTPLLLHLKKNVERVTKTSFNSVLLNLYRDENDSVAWHADDEKELGINPVIASLTLGCERVFQLKHTSLKQKHSLVLKNGSLLVMKGQLQHFWLHRIPKNKQPCSPRINLTFRKIM